MKIVQKLCTEPVEDMEYYTFKKLKVAGVDAILSITGYTGAGGCEIYVANEDGEKLWKALWQEGSKEGLKNIGSVPATRCVWRWVSASTVMISTIRLRLSRRA